MKGIAIRSAKRCNEGCSAAWCQCTNNRPGHIPRSGYMLEDVERHDDVPCLHRKRRHIVLDLEHIEAISASTKAFACKVERRARHVGKRYLVTELRQAECDCTDTRSVVERAGMASGRKQLGQPCHSRQVA